MCESVGGKQETTQHPHCRKVSAASQYFTYKSLFNTYLQNGPHFLHFNSMSMTLLSLLTESVWVMDQQAADSTGCTSPSLCLVRHIFVLDGSPALQMFPVVQLQKIQWSRSNNSASRETLYSFYDSVFWVNLCFVSVRWQNLQWCESEAPQLISKSCLFLRFGEKSCKLKQFWFY